MRLVGAIALVTTILVVTGCGERAEPLERELDAYPVAVRGAAREATTVDRRPDRIVALDSGAADLLVALGAGDRLVGVPGEWTGIAAPDAVPVVRPSVGLDVGAVAVTRADLVVAPRSFDQGEVADAARRTGAAVYVQPDDSVDAVLRATVELGLLVGEPARGRTLAARVAREVADVRERVAELPRLRVYVDTGFLATVAPDSLVADVVASAGGDPVGEAAAALGPNVACRVLELRPDVVLALDDAGTAVPSPSRILRRCPHARGPLPRTARVAAGLVTRPGPQVGDAVAAVARALHRDALP